MIHQASITIPQRDIRRLIQKVDPIVANDAGYAVKSWLKAHPGFAVRPWQVVGVTEGCVKIVGWSAAPITLAELPDGVRCSVTEFSATTDVRLHGRIVPVRRASRSAQYSHDAAANARSDDQRAASYDFWLRERLADLLGAADVVDITIADMRRSFVMRKERKGAATIVRRIEIPVVDVDIELAVKDPRAVEAWLLHGCGPQKAFGYGGFIPCH